MQICVSIVSIFNPESCISEPRSSISFASLKAFSPLYLLATFIQGFSKISLTCSLAPRLSTSTTTALLASKSNYQNILEGIQVPGLTYPSALATNLTSKRTSHKIAEQGRRNRINTALGEIAALLPAGMGGSATDGGEGSGGTGGNNTNSKARTVEAAIEYIRMLKGEVKELKGKLEGLEKNSKAQIDEESKRQEGNSPKGISACAEKADTNSAAVNVSAEASTEMSH